MSEKSTKKKMVLLCVLIIVVTILTITFYLHLKKQQEAQTYLNRAYSNLELLGGEEHFDFPYDYERYTNVAISSLKDVGKWDAL